MTKDELGYDEQVELIEAQNEPILSAFEQWLAAKGLSPKTIRKHVNNIRLFAEYLVYYDPLEPLIEAGSGDIYMFCGNWFPRKAMWASASSARSNMTSFRKFAAFMVEAGYWHKEREQNIRETLKENKEEFIKTAESYYDKYDNMW